MAGDDDDLWSEEEDRRTIRKRRGKHRASSDDNWIEDDDPSTTTFKSKKKAKPLRTNLSAFEDAILQSRIPSIQAEDGLLGLTTLLAKTGFRGPLHHHRLDLMRRRKIGQGAQFEVYRDPEMGSNLVYKVVRLSPSPHDSSDEVLLQRRLESIRLEILALSHPPIRDHRNIIQLMYWGYDYPSLDPDSEFRLPVLVLEEAKHSLADFLEKIKPSWEVRYHLCLDVYDGLATLHRWNIVHGDVKPDNVLVCLQDNADFPFVAKLSDFGLCISMDNKVPLDYHSYRGTKAWIPAEVREDVYDDRDCDFTPAHLFKCDAFSAGLLAVSAMVTEGKPPVDVVNEDTDELAWIAGNLLDDDETIPSDVKSRFKSMLFTQLHEDPFRRKDVSYELLKVEENTTFAKWLTIREKYIGSHLSLENAKYMTLHRGIWYWARIDPVALQLIEDSVAKTRTAYAQYATPGETLYGITLDLLTFRKPGFVDKVLEYTLAAAKNFYMPAQGVCEQLFQAHGKSLPDDIDETVRLQWLFNAASTGSVFAFKFLWKRDQAQAKLARRVFGHRGGFNVESYTGDEPYAYPVTDRRSVRKTLEGLGHIPIDTYPVDFAGNKVLHQAASRGDTAAVEFYVTYFHGSVDALNDAGETALLHACRAGHADVVRILTKQKANAALARPSDGQTPLHWLFNFVEEDMLEVAEMLLRAGATIDAKTYYPKDGIWSIPAFHFPFQWPLGTPLHWAVAMQSTRAIEILCSLLADVNAPDTIDDNGQTPLSMACNRADVPVVELLLEKGADATIADGKGRNAMYMVSQDYTTWNRGIPLWKGYERWMYLGNEAHCSRAVHETVDLLKKHECDPNLMLMRIEMTPIASAIQVGDCHAVLALLNAGAELNTCLDATAAAWISLEPHRVLPFASTYHETFRNLLIYSPNLDGVTNAVITARNHSLELIEKNMSILFDAGILKLNVNGLDPETRKPAILEAAEAESLPMDRVQIMRLYGADIYAVSEYGETLLMMLCKNILVRDSECHDFINEHIMHLGDVERRTIVDAVCTRDEADDEGSTALMYAAFGTKVRVVDLLLKMGAEANGMRAWSKHTALDMALDAAEEMRRDAIIKAYGTFLPDAARKEIMENGNLEASKGEGGETELDFEVRRYRYRNFPRVIELLREHGARRAIDMGVEGQSIFYPEEWDEDNLPVYGIADTYDPGVWRCLYQ